MPEIQIQMKETIESSSPPDNKVRHGISHNRSPISEALKTSEGMSHKSMVVTRFSGNTTTMNKTVKSTSKKRVSSNRLKKLTNSSIR